MMHFLYFIFLVTGASASQVHSMAEGTRHKHTNGFGVPWGPQKCAELLHSDAGTCVIRTQCEGVDLSKFEFAFDCVSSGEIQRHSFGIGGFDDDDDFDTNVKCTTCLPPDADSEEKTTKPHHTHHEIGVENVIPASAVHKNHIHQEVAVSKIPSAASFHATVPKSPHTHHEVVVVGVKLASAGQDEEKEEAEKKEEGKKEEHPAPPANPTKYGPGDCISTWRNDTSGTCIMQTSCSGQKTVDHMFGLICKTGKGNGTLVRHVFGRDSFEATETFDTLISCDECLSMGYVKEESIDRSLAGAVKNLAGMVSQVKDGMKSLKEDVAVLKTKVFDKDDQNSTAKKEEDAEGEAADATDAEDAAEAVNTSAPEKNETALFDSGVKKHVTIRKPVKLRGGTSTSRRERHQENTDDADNDEDDSS